MVTVEFQNVREMEKRLAKAARWGDLDVKNLRKANRKVGNEYVKALRGAITDSPVTVRMYRDGNVTEIPPGTLRRSLGNWSPKGDRRGTIMSGPRVGGKGFRNRPTNKDGFFAHWVEEGVARKNKYTGPNTGVFRKTLQSVTQRMRSVQAELYRQQFKKFVGNL